MIMLTEMQRALVAAQVALLSLGDATSPEQRQMELSALEQCVKAIEYQLMIIRKGVKQKTI